MDRSIIPSLNIPETGRPRVIVIGGGFGGIHAINHLIIDTATPPKNAAAAIQQRLILLTEPCNRQK